MTAGGTAPAGSGGGRASGLAPLGSDAVQAFWRQGFLLLRGAVGEARVARMRAAALRELAADREPLEREWQTGYPGAPESAAAPGGATVRRLLRAYDRDPVFARWVHDRALGAVLRQLLAGGPVHFSQAHHNCIMTKQPRHSSDTGWHQDVRYWRFDDQQLVNAWLALTPETRRQGSLCLLPGSHRLTLGAERLDEALFLRPEHPDNAPLLATEVQVELAAGDLLLFHAALLHRATRNRGTRPKLAAVFTFHGPDTRPLPGTRSASLPEIVLEP